MKHLAWMIGMAWRDSRRGRGRLLLFMAAMAVGIAGLVAIRSFQSNIRAAVDRQAGELLGADIAVNSRRPFTTSMLERLAEAPGEVTWQRSLSTMLGYDDNRFSRLVRLRAVGPGFPYYGSFRTEPAGVAGRIHEGNYALVDEGVMLQAGAAVGDTIQLGEGSFTIAGKLLDVPGEIALWTQLSPRVFIGHDALDGTGLVQPGSRVFYRAIMRIDDAEALAVFAEELREIEAAQGIRVETIASRQERLGRSLDNVYRFLDLFAVAALLLGGIGVGSAVHVYIRQKLRTVAILRCLGASRATTVQIYLLQMLVIGVFGAVLGALAGMLVQHLLPAAFTDLVPADMTVSVAWGAVWSGLMVGAGVTGLVAALPLLAVRRMSPLAAIRSSIEPPPPVWRDPVRLGLWLLSIVCLYLLIALALGSWGYGAVFASGLVALFALLGGCAALLTYLTRRWLPRRAPFVVRQGLNNLYRPNNQTPVLMTCLGLGAFLFALIFAVQHLLLAQLAYSHDIDAPNALLFDIQSDELPGVRALLAEHQTPILQEAPIVTMRLGSVAGKKLPELREQKEPEIEGWVLNREYRSSYRDHLTDGERIVAGEFVGRVDPATAFTSPVPISIEEGIAESLHVGLGDSIVFDVQGLPIETVVASIRTVDWYQMRPNFFVIFPAGVLEDAPQNHLVASRLEEAEHKLALQRELLTRYPTVSFIDAAGLIATLDGVFGKLTFAVRFMSLFSIAAGLLVLVGTVATSRYQRLQESTLLRTMGASRRQITSIAACEFALLGAFAGLTGTLLALAGSWALARYWFEAKWLVAPWPLIVLWLLVSGLTVLVGLLNTRQTLRRPPLEVLRQQAGG